EDDMAAHMTLSLRSLVNAAILALCTCAAVAAQQPTVTLTVRVLSGGEPVHLARVSADTAEDTTGTLGVATLRLPAGEHTLLVQSEGYHSVERRIVLRAATDTALTIELESAVIEHEAIIVSSTRTDRRIE